MNKHEQDRIHSSSLEILKTSNLSFGIQNKQLLHTQRVEVTSRYQKSNLDKWIKEAKNSFQIDISKITETKFYLLESENSKFINFSEEILSDVVLDKFCFQEWSSSGAKFAIEVGFKAGVTDNLAKAVRDAFHIFGASVNVSTGKIYWIHTNADRNDMEKLSKEILANPLLNNIQIFIINDLKKQKRFSNIKLPKTQISGSGKVENINLDISDKKLSEISKRRCLALTIDELKVIKKFYSRPEVQKKRQILNLPASPTDLELEVFAQTWSEHCKHKIFAAEIEYSEFEKPKYGPALGDFKINGLFKKFIKDTTEKIKTQRNLNWLISVFSDNAGIVRFDKNVDLCFKAETHNSPSALDPYGGALTGILGVNRDILGCGLGARPVANTNVFCLAPANLGDQEKRYSLPVGPKSPRRMLEGVHKGVEDGGNKSGVPTVNGAFFFDPSYAGKPLVFCGTVGVMPQFLKDGRGTEVKGQKARDRIYMVGGAIGVDGIHGATFSSLELDKNSPSTAVQIGDPITQKRVLDFMIQARDLGLFTSVTDNGAGGLSSSVGEMAELSGGACVDLAKAPTKYSGLKPYELFISESQERMTFSVDPLQALEFEALAKRHSVCATDIGEFTNTGYLDVRYNDKSVGYLDIKFLHKGLPQMKLKAVWKPNFIQEEKWFKNKTVQVPPQVLKQGLLQEKALNKQKNLKSLSENADKTFFTQQLKNILARPTIASKEEWVRRYDHEVQGATHIKPFGGHSGEAPNDSGVIWLAPHGGEKTNAVAIGCGLAPRISLQDTYIMAQFAVDEAVRNVVASGGDPETLCLLDNFCWPDPIFHSEKNPQGSHKLAQLVRACKGLSDACEAYGAPLVSGKDSMKNDFRGKNGYGQDIKISVLSTLLVSAMAKVDVRHSQQSSFKSSTDLIYLIGGFGSGLLGSELLAQLELQEDQQVELPLIKLQKNYELYKKIYMGVQKNIFTSLHDISEGGLAVSLAESCFGNVALGAKIQISGENSLDVLFNETPGRFLASIAFKNKAEFENLLGNKAFCMGEVTNDKKLEILSDQGETLIQDECEVFKKAWKASLC